MFLFILLSLICASIIILLHYLRHVTDGRVSKWEKKILDNYFNDNAEQHFTDDYSNKKLQIDENDLVDNLKIYIDNRRVMLRSKLLFKYNRYYFGLTDLDKIFGDIVKLGNGIFQIGNGSKRAVVDLRKNSFRNNIEEFFSVPAVNLKNTWYISLIDITRIFNLKTIWDYANKEIRFYSIKKEPINVTRKRLKRPALIRLEDIGAGGDYSDSLSLQKLRIVAEMLNSKGFTFHVAWVPRYKNPLKGIDNNLINDLSMFNADFLFTLDYMISKGGIVGLHGYTHQHSDGVSVDDSEFGKDGDPSVEAAETRVHLAINTARTLNIPYSFFESPHYSCTEKQQAVFEKYFNYIFEPCQGIWNDKPIKSPRNNRTIYVPAPLGYVHGNDINDMIKRIKNNPINNLAALFYHPYKEFDYITLKETEQGIVEYSYSNSSMLNAILNCLEKEDYSLVRITDIRF